MTTDSTETLLFLEPEQLKRVNREFLRYVRRNFPMRFYPGESRAKVCPAAALLRMCDTVEAMMALLTRRNVEDARVLLRSLYEQVVVVCWVAIDPDKRQARWEGESRRQRLSLHNEMVKYGQPLLTAARSSPTGRLHAYRKPP